MALTSLTSEKLKNLDATAHTAGLRPCVLMERAGMALADFLRERLTGKERVGFLCGPGNNGGDGFVAARHLAHHGVEVEIVCTSKRRKGEAKDNRRLLGAVGVPVHAWRDGADLSRYDVLVDCLLGYGQDAAPHGTVAEVIEAARATTAKVYACDTPTGLGTDTGEAFEPHLTGDIIVAGIGIPAQVYEQIGLKKGTFLVEGTKRL